jgi:hypothetical protein
MLPLGRCLTIYRYTKDKVDVTSFEILSVYDHYDTYFHDHYSCSSHIFTLNGMYNHLNLVVCEDYGYISLESSRKCLKLHHTEMTWLEANGKCASAGENILSITTKEMLDDVVWKVYQAGILI